MSTVDVNKRTAIEVDESIVKHTTLRLLPTALPSYTCVLHRHLAPFEEKFWTMGAAILCMIDAMNGEDAWPETIRVHGHVLWEQSGPFRTRAILMEFAKANNIEL